MSKTECNDKKCPYHGEVKVRGLRLKGKIVSSKPAKTVTVERKILQYVPKFERYKKTKSKIHAHKPECIEVKEGDTVIVGETRKLSKTKSFVVMEILSDKNESNKR